MSDASEADKQNESNQTVHRALAEIKPCRACFVDTVLIIELSDLKVRHVGDVNCINI